MIESAESLAFVTHILCCSWAMCFSAAASSENDQGSMNLASNTAPVALDHAVEGGRHPSQDRVLDPALDVCDDLAGIALEPAPIELLGRGPELDDEVVGEVLGFDLAALLAPEAEKRALVVAHDDPRVRAADESAAFRVQGKVLFITI